MSQRPNSRRTHSRMAEEKKLKAEEQWLTETLKLIKQQRLALQMERQFLESQLPFCRNLMNNRIRAQQSVGQQRNQESTHSTPPTQQVPRVEPTETKPTVDTTSGVKQEEFDVPEVEGQACNLQDLNLNEKSSDEGSKIPDPKIRGDERRSANKTAPQVSGKEKRGIDIDTKAGPNE